MAESVDLSYGLLSSHVQVDRFETGMLIPIFDNRGSVMVMF